MTNEEHDAAKEVINEKLKNLAIELGKLTVEIMALENSPLCKASMEVTNIMGVGQIDIRVQMPNKDFLNGLSTPEQAEEEAKAPDVQVDELLKSMKSKGNSN